MGRVPLIRLAPGLYVLRTYQERFDGLSYVAARLDDGAASADHDETYGGPRTVLIPGMPDRYASLLEPDDVNVCYTTFETDRLPRLWSGALNHFYDSCIVPHRAIKKVFLDSAVRIPIHVAHQGYTRLAEHPGGHVPPSDRFVVGFLGVPAARKNLDLLFAACRMLREDGTIPDLRLHAHIATLYNEIDPARLAPLRSESWVELSEGKLDEARLKRWFDDVSVYCFPSSGEGWSFTPRESLYLGVPTILSDIPVHRDLVKSGFCEVVPHRGLKPAVLDQLLEGRRETTTRGRWYDICIEDIRAAILEVYSDNAAAQSKARAGAQWIARRWQNQASVARVKQILRGVVKHR